MLALAGGVLVLSGKSTAACYMHVETELGLPVRHSRQPSQEMLTLHVGSIEGHPACLPLSSVCQLRPCSFTHV